MCGEQASVKIGTATYTGSPPRVRGTAFSTGTESLYGGITPACAGNSSPCVLPFCFAGDHPRVCGEQLHRGSNWRSSVGSPPRVRGTDRLVLGHEGGGGITPACAGNSRKKPPRVISCRDHPRVCGEQTKKSPSFLHSFLSDQENSFSLKYNCSISSQSFCARWTSLQGSSKCFAKVDS